jgi:hypothetical protein
MAKKDQPDQSGNGASNDRNYRGDGSDMLNFDDDELGSDRGNTERTGGTWAAQGADSGKLAPPREILSDRNGPSDSDHGGKKRPS